MNGKVTGIEAQKKNTDRVNIYIDYEFSFACSLELVYKYKIQKGNKIEEESIIEITEEDNYFKGKNDALKCIERTYKSEKEVIDKLLDKEYEEKTINRVMEFMKEYNFVNDSRYANAYIKEKMNGAGREKIKFALKNKGIPEHIIEEKLNLLLEGNEKVVARELAKKKLNILIKNEKDKNKLYKKLGDFLVTKGFNFEIVKEVVPSILKEVTFEIEKEAESFENDNEDDNEDDELLELAEKRYNIIIKSEKDNRKVYKKLSDYLLRKGYGWDEIKVVLKKVVMKVGD